MLGHIRCKLCLLGTGWCLCVPSSCKVIMRIEMDVSAGIHIGCGDMSGCPRVASRAVTRNLATSLR